MEVARSPLRLPNIIRISGAKVVSGRGRGRTIGIPTINVEPTSVPPSLARGIYACTIRIGAETFAGALHYGPRPAFNDTETMEIHVIDAEVKTVTPTVDLALVAFLRGVENFPDVESLKKAIAGDIEAARAMLAA